MLVLAYYFPPVGGAGVQRTLKFVKYLASFGWDATVISTRSRAYGALDASLLAEVPQTTRVVRTAALPLARYVAFALYRLRLMRLRAFLLWPDGGLGWVPFAFLAALRAVRRDRPDVLFSTSAPYGSHLVALLVARLTGLPWVADFRDEWAANPYLSGQPVAREVVGGPSGRSRARHKDRRGRRVLRLEGSARRSRRVEIVNGVDETTSPSGPPGRRRIASCWLTSARSTSSGIRAGAAGPRRLVIQGEIPGSARGRPRRQRLDPGLPPRPGIYRRDTGYVEHARDRGDGGGDGPLALCARREPRAVGEAVRVPRLGPAAPVPRAEGEPREPPRERVAGRGRLGARRRERDRQAILELWRRWQEDNLSDQDEVRARVLERYSRRANAARLAGVLEDARDG